MSGLAGVSTVRLMRSRSDVSLMTKKLEKVLQSRVTSVETEVTKKGGIQSFPV